MLQEELNYRINKCKETITKKETLISKREKSIEKKIKELHSLGYKGNTYEELRDEKELYRELYFNEPIFQDGYDIIYDISNYVDSIKSAKKSIEDENEKLQKYENMLEVETSKNDILINLPETIITFMNDIIARWNEYDKLKKHKINQYFNEYDRFGVNYKEFCRNVYNKFGKDAFEFRQKTDEQIEKDNTRDAKNLILDFINRVSEKTGTITSFSNLSLDRDNSGYAIINGIVKGVKGDAKVESIYAGGYNIQRLHIRVLVK